MISLTSTTLRSSAGIFLARTASLPLMFATAVIIARGLSGQERGIYALLLLFSGLWLPIFSFGQWASVSYLVGSRRYKVRDVAVTTSVLSLIIGGLVTCVVVILWVCEMLGDIARSIQLFEMALMVGILPLKALQLMLTRLLVADAKYRKSSFFDLTAVILFLGLLLIGLVVLPAEVSRLLGNNLRVVIFCYSVSQVIVTVILVISVWRTYYPVWQWQSIYLQESFSYGWRAWWGDITGRLNLRGDQMLLSYFVVGSDLGTYAIAVTLAELLWNIPDSLNFVLFNRLAANKNQETSAELTEKIHRLLLVGMSLLAVLASLLVPYLVTFIFGGKYDGAIVPLWLMLPGTVFFTSPKVLSKFFTSTGSPSIASWVTFCGMLLGLLTCAVMLTIFPELGIKSAAIGTSFGYLLSMFLSILIYSSLRGRSMYYLFIPRLDDFKWLRLHFKGRIVGSHKS